MTLTRQQITTTLLAAIGAATFLWLGLPLPWLLGPMLICLIAALAGTQLQALGLLTVLMRTVLGVAVGASITPDVIRQLPDIAASLTIAVAFTAVIAAVGYPLLRKVFGFDHATAWYGAMPGGLQDMLIFGEEAGGNVRALSLIHATRVLVIVVVAPLLMQLYWQADLTRPPGRSILDSDLVQLAIMLAAGIAGWRIAARIGLFGASILGPMIASAALSLAGTIDQRPPAELIQATQFVLGISIGARYVGITGTELRQFVVAGLVYAVILALLTLGVFEIVVLLKLAPGIDALLAFLPGGQAELVVIAIIVGADMAYVVSHHLLRMVVVLTLSPIVSRLIQRLWP